MVGQVAGMDYTMVVQMVVVSPIHPRDRKTGARPITESMLEREPVSVAGFILSHAEREARVANSPQDFSAGLGQINRPIGMIFGL
jgi:hypothetical protein